MVCPGAVARGLVPAKYDKLTLPARKETRMARILRSLSLSRTSARSLAILIYVPLTPPEIIPTVPLFMRSLVSLN